MVEKYIQLFQDTESGQKELLISPNVSLLKIEVDGSGSLSANAMLDRESELYEFWIVFYGGFWIL